MSSIYRIRKVTLKDSPHRGKEERWEPLIQDGKFVLSPRYPSARRHCIPSVMLVATIEAAIKLLDTGQYCIRLVGLLTGKDTQLVPNSAIIER